MLVHKLPKIMMGTTSTTSALLWQTLVMVQKCPPRAQVLEAWSPKSR